MDTERIVHSFERGIIDRLDVAIQMAMEYHRQGGMTMNGQPIVVKMIEMFPDDNLLLRTFMMWAGLNVGDGSQDAVTELRALLV